VPIDRPLASYRFHPASKTVAETDRRDVDWDEIRRRYVPLLPLHERWIARHRIATQQAGALYTRSARMLAEGNRAEARALFAAGVRRYPPSVLLSRNGLGALRRIVSGRA
jgi:hypothetical protein